MQSRQRADKPGTEKGQAAKVREAFGLVLNTPLLQQRSRELGLPETLGQWGSLLSDDVVSKLPPTARQAFDSLCRSGCHRLMLAVLLAFEPRHMRSALQLLGGPLDKNKRQQAAKTLQAAAIVLRKWGVPAPTARGELSEDAREKNLVAILGPVFRSSGRVYPLLLARQLEIYVRVLKLAAALGTRAETHLSKYLITAYVQAVAPRANDRAIAVLIAQCFSLPTYNPAQHKMWRTRHFGRLEARYELIPLLEELDAELRLASNPVTAS